MTTPQDTPPSDTTLPRPQRRLLARLFNARTTPICVDGRELLTFQEAKRYLLSLEPEPREAAYHAIKTQAER
ncbi:hypothetical protein [Novosphingobium decolorationis]|uniref:Uncharacterized protein n=1 Tax=Novosphingobium decolorationis TaxID=2698673 RepID=A0ABX8E7T4_9SPHN|nr:hypothetical protein [Novosphingobium decolorationis]MED5546347.1 hypothetical protein [Pseudomonadota bacterium]QVM84275.1 hypothetical protein HT578_11765 [Novosphingobium decolorationis]